MRTVRCSLNARLPSHGVNLPYQLLAQREMRPCQGQRGHPHLAPLQHKGLEAGAFHVGEQPPSAHSTREPGELRALGQPALAAPGKQDFLLSSAPLSTSRPQSSVEKACSPDTGVGHAGLSMNKGQEAAPILPWDIFHRNVLLYQSHLA